MFTKSHNGFLTIATAAKIKNIEYALAYKITHYYISNEKQTLPFNFLLRIF